MCRRALTLSSCATFMAAHASLLLLLCVGFSSAYVMPCACTSVLCGFCLGGCPSMPGQCRNQCLLEGPNHVNQIWFDPYRACGLPLPCQIGEVYDTASFTCYDCPAGNFCPVVADACCERGGSFAFCSACIKPCPLGTISRSGPNVSRSDCQSCLVGQYADTNRTTCLTAPMCPDTNPQCYPGGCNATGASCGISATVNGVQVPVCAQAANASALIACPAGCHCPRAPHLLNFSAFLCPVGTFAGSGQSACQSCSAGYFCPDVGLIRQIPCNPGYYCPALSSQPTPCPAGYVSLPASNSSSACRSCGPGSFGALRSEERV